MAETSQPSMEIHVYPKVKGAKVFVNNIIDISDCTVSSDMSLFEDKKIILYYLPIVLLRGCLCMAVPTFTYPEQVQWSPTQ